MKKRGFKFGDYDTAAVYGEESPEDPNYAAWTLTSWELSEPELVENYINVPGRLDGPLDASTTLTNGDPSYGHRKLTATFEMSDFDRAEREIMISDMRNLLDGRRHDIEIPDYPYHYLTGRVRVEKLYNDLAHASVRVTAVCNPWLYSKTENKSDLIVTSKKQVELIRNGGSRLVVPTITISGGPVTIEFIGPSYTSVYESLSEGSYQMPDIYLGPMGEGSIHYSGSGILLIRYREAML